MKNILVPIDFSNYSINAAKAAAAIALKSGSVVHLLHVTDIPVGWENQPVELQQQYPQLESRLVEAEMKLDKFSKFTFLLNCNVIARVQGGVAFEQIEIFARKNKIDLIVMGVHGDEEAPPKFIGSTAQRVIRTSSCPVLSVRKNFNMGEIKKILFASDFDENVGTAINTITNMASDFGANIDFAYINTPDHVVDEKVIESRMKKFMAAQHKVKFHAVIENCNEKDNGIIQCAEKRHANVIAMVTHAKKQKSDYLFGVTDAVLFHSKVPVLSFVLDEYRKRNN